MSCSGSNGVSETVLSEITLLLGQDRESTDLLVKDLAPAGVANLLLDSIVLRPKFGAHYTSQKLAPLNTVVVSLLPVTIKKPLG
jgi:hypothetical protein